MNQLSKGPKKKAIKAQVKRLNRLGDEVGIKTNARYLLVTLYSYTDENGWCFPAHATIAKDTGLAERTIRYALNELEAVGLIRIAKPAKLSNGVKSQFNIGAKKVPRGQQLYLVWPIASAYGRSNFAELCGMRPKEGEDLKKCQWFVDQGREKPPHGPNTYEQLAKFIREGHVSAISKVARTTDGPWFPAVDVPVFAPEFQLAGVS